MKDELYQKAKGGEGTFRFDGSVVEVFDDMIRRSVPGYGLTLEMIGVVAQKAFGAAGGTAYDLGCSLGASMFPILGHTDAHVIGVDLSADMLAQAEQTLAQNFPKRYQLHQGDLAEFEFSDSARLVVSNFTLQFLPIGQRYALLQRMYDALEPGGVFLMSEKFTTDDSSSNELLRDLHHTFKAAQGYSELEIARKRDAIENVLVPETANTHLERLSSLGFENPVCWYQCFNFASFLAIK